MTRCEECAFVHADHAAADLPGEIRDLGRRYRPPLTRLLRGEDPSILRVRPAPGVWSALEYAAHVPDVLAFYRRRITAVLTADRPTLEGFDADAVDHSGDDIDATLALIDEEADALAAILEGLDDADWARIGIGLDGDERDVLTLARRALHDPNHHLLDIGRGLRAVRTGGA